ncbi:MAG: hypothetical protein DDT34_01155 [Firmicutes bacterium]|nr:hypothetical protein [Bacillota bacterium]MBT9165637.1 hypothetical protein [Chloroflexota bacterium]
MSDKSIYIKSNGDEKNLVEDGRIPAWSITVRNLGQNRIYSMAYEGGYKLVSKCPSFSMLLISCRMVQIRLPASRLTKKVKAQGVAEMISRLVSDGLAPLDYEIKDEELIPKPGEHKPTTKE